MKFAITALATFAGLAMAQLNLPSCATSCVTKFTSGTNIGDCQSVNIACICKNENFLSEIACCLAGACNQADQEKATSEALTFCRVAGGVTGLPTAVSCASLSATQSSTGTSATGTVTSSGSVTTTSSTATTTTGSGTVAGQTSSRASTSTTASATPNAGAKHAAGMGAGVLGAFAVALL